MNQPITNVRAPAAQAGKGAPTSSGEALRYDIGYVDADGSFKIVLHRGAPLPAVGFFLLDPQSQQQVKSPKRVIFAVNGAAQEGSRRPLAIVGVGLEDGKGGAAQPRATRIVVRVDGAGTVSMEAAADGVPGASCEIHIFDKPPAIDVLRRLWDRVLARKTALLPYARGIADDAVARARQLVMRFGAAGKLVDLLGTDQVNQRETYIRVLYLDLALDFLESTLDAKGVDRASPAPTARFSPIDSDHLHFIAEYFVGDGTLPDLPKDPPPEAAPAPKPTPAARPPRQHGMSGRYAVVAAAWLLIIAAGGAALFRHPLLSAITPVTGPPSNGQHAANGPTAPLPAHQLEVAPPPTVAWPAPPAPPGPAVTTFDNGSTGAASQTAQRGGKGGRLALAAPKPPAIPAPVIDRAQLAFDRARAARSVAAWDQFLNEFGTSPLATRAREERQKLVVALQQPPPGSQKAVLYEADANGGDEKSYTGWAVWRTVAVPPRSGGAPEWRLAVTVEIPGRLALAFWLAVNTDQELPASHTGEMMFRLPPDVHSGDVSRVSDILMAQSPRTLGTALGGYVAQVAGGRFMVALSDSAPDQDGNLRMLKERPWLEIPIVYADGHGAILEIEKGAQGTRALSDAFARWAMASGPLLRRRLTLAVMPFETSVRSIRPAQRSAPRPTAATAPRLTTTRGPKPTVTGAPRLTPTSTPRPLGARN